MLNLFSPNKLQEDSQLRIVFLVLLILMGFGLRLTLLGSKSLWLDESRSLLVAEQGQIALWNGLAERYHPPLYYLLLNWWMYWGKSEFIVRLMAAIPDTISIALLYRLGCQWLNRSISLTAVSLFTASPLMIWYAQEARPYTLMACWGLCIMITTTKLWQRPSLLLSLLLTTQLATALYLHYFAIFLIPIQILLLVNLITTQQATKSAIFYWLITLPLALAAFWPWLQTPSPQIFFTNIVFSDKNYIATLLSNLLGFAPDFAQLLLILLVIGLPIGLSFVWAVYKLSQRPDYVQWFRTIPQRPWLQKAITLLFISLLILFVIPRAYSLKRQLVMFWPYALLLFALFLPQLDKNYKKFAIIFFLSMAAALTNIIFIPKSQWREAVTAVLKQHQANDIVILQPNYMTTPFDYYNQSSIDRVGLPIGVKTEELERLSYDYQRVWLLLHETDRALTQLTKKWFDEHSNLTEMIDFYNLQLYLYESEPQTPLPSP